MKRYLLIMGLLLVGLTSCLKNDNQPTPEVDPAVQAKADDETIQAYLAANPGISATKDTAGFYYQIITEGTGPNITTSNLVTVDYEGKTVKGSVFDSSTGFTTGIADRDNLIEGWKLGLQKAKKGAKMLLILPSRLGYGPFTAGSIPANSVLIFTITVRDVK